MPFNSRVAHAFALCTTALLAVVSTVSAIHAQTVPIDRQALVSRHNVVHRSADPKHFLQVGNGDFAFAFDVTGMQTLDRSFETPIPLHTMSNWGWHSFPNTEGYTYEQTLSEFRVGDRTVTYADQQNTPAGGYFRANPHRINLARISLWWDGQDGEGATEADRDDFTDIEQTLDVWTGTATSRYTFRGEPVTVTTVADPRHARVGFRIASPLVSTGKLGAVIRFSYPCGEWGPRVDDFSKPQAHRTQFHADPDGVARFERELDDYRYVAVADAGPAASFQSAGAHAYRVAWKGGPTAELTVAFAEASDEVPSPTPEPADFARMHAASALHWSTFWSTGGAIDLSETDDPRAAELERRIVLSQYLTAVQNGSLPPQETGLVCNSWFGKAHLEMHWWHAAHFPLWGREERLTPSLEWYKTILPQARAIAKRQGYAGARWPKMSGPDGVSSPSGVGEFLIWQQPHIIALAELVYRAQPEPEVLPAYGELVAETARFMADYAQPDDDGVYHLGPPLIPAQENYRPRVTRDPTYELAYWHWALSTAQAWRERAGEPREPAWDKVIAGLARPNMRDGVYTGVTVEPYTNRADHPSMLCALGVLPATPLIDVAVMERTARDVESDWNWNSTWGWDFPVLAMTYARCGDAERAVDALLRETPKNTYLPNGHNYQEPRLPLYLPGNGGVLAATAMMAAGWDTPGNPRPAPGFPESWKVRHEGLRPLP